LKTAIKIFSVTLTIFTLSCNNDKPDCFKSTGKIITEERSLGPFQSIHLSDDLNLIITDDTIQKVSVEAGENLLTEIKTEIKQGQLYISNNNKCNWVRSYKKTKNVYLSLKDVIDVIHYGSGNISSRELLHKDTIIFHLYSNGNINLNINSNYIWLDMDNLGDFDLSGKTNTVVSNTIGLGKLSTQNLACKDFYQKSDGQGNSFIRSDSSLRVEITNEGNIYYTGNPAVIWKVESGAGRLIAQ
jgi:hypothetical protein